MSEKNRYGGKSIDEFKPGDVITMVGPGETEKGSPDYSLVGKKLKLRAVVNGVIYLQDLTPGMVAFGSEYKRYYWLCCLHWDYYEEQ